MHRDALEAAKEAQSDAAMLVNAVQVGLVEERPMSIQEELEAEAEEYAAAQAAKHAEAVKKRAEARAEDAAVVLAAPVPKPKRYVVQRRISIYYNGQFITLQAGTDVSPRYYGADAVQKMRDAGVDIREED